MTDNKGHNRFLIATALSAYLADAITIWLFILEKIFLEFWTFRWIAGLCFIIAFLYAGGALLRLGGQTVAAKKAIVIFGSFYLLCSFIIYAYFGYQQVVNGISWDDYLGYLVILAVLCVIGISSLKLFTEDKYLQIPAYGFVILDLIFSFALVHKYVAKAEPFILSVFVGEVLILGIGALLFMGNYFVATDQQDVAPSINNQQQDTLITSTE